MAKNKIFSLWQMKNRAFSLRHLQKHLPWTIPYTEEFRSSRVVNPRRGITHDVLHIIKSLGRIAAECERGDHPHGLERKLEGREFAREVADLVICALHIANAENFDLNNVVVNCLQTRNGKRIPHELR